MSKKKTGLLVALGTIVGAAAAGISYYLKHKSLKKDAEEDFFEEEEEMDGTDSEVSSCEPSNRTYITLNKSCECTEDCCAEDTCECSENCECQEACECQETCDCADEAAEEPAETCATATIKEDTEGAVS